MFDHAHFAYAQARLQSRHGARPDERLWRRLQAVGDPGNYIQVAQRSVLRPWVLGLQARQNSHEIESALSHRYREYVDEVANWLPGNWVVPMHWMKYLPDLPALQHLLGQEAAPSWMLDDPLLRPFATENISARIEAMRESDYACLINAWQPGTSLYQNWFACWQSRWPKSGRFSTGLQYLGRSVLNYLYTRKPGSTVSTRQQREQLAQMLQAAFRRYSFQPGACCAHLSLVALDLGRLRGAIVRRMLFSGLKEVSS